ncbi:MAG: radical SAM protein [Deltaproteobacteria bacterium]|nr:radical SAM protein [Deltaproteobacteria bacterium]
MRVAFLNPPLHLARDFIDYPYFGNVGLLQAAAVCREAGFEVAVLDAFARGDSDLTERPGGGLRLGGAPGPLVDALAAARPDVVVVAHGPFVHPASAGAAHLDEVLGLVRRRLAGARVVLADCHVGGMHYREYDPEVVLRRTGAAHLCRYEAEAALPALLATLREGAAVPRILRGDAEVDLETLPAPAFADLDLAAYDRFLERCFTSRLRVPLFDLEGRTLPLLLSRGCVYRCLFCTSNPGLKPGEAKRHRRVSRDRAATLLRHLARDLGARTVVILDEMANLEAAEFARVLEVARDLDLRLELPNGLRADRLTREHLELLRGRTTRVSISAESGSQRVVDEVVRKRQDLAAVRRVAAEAAEVGVPLLVHFIVGLPGERRGEVLETLRLAGELHEQHGARPALQFATPLEGSPLWEQTRAAAGGGVTAGDLAAQLQVRPVLGGTDATAHELAAAKLLFEARLDATATAKLILNLSYRCNNSCLFCAVGDRGSAGGTFAAQRAVLVEHLRRGIRLLDFDGGEPTLVPHLLPLVQYARRIGYERVCVTTNGRRLAYEKFAAALLGSGITDLLVSMHGPNAEVHEGLTRSPGSFGQTVAGIENAVRLSPDGRVDLGVNTTLTTANYRHLPEFAALVRSLGVRKLNVQFVTPFGRARAEIVPDPADAAAMVRQVIDEHGDALKVQVINLPFCFMPGYERHLLPDLFKHQRNMMFVSSEEVNLFDYLAATRERREPCAECLLSIACEGFYSFATAPLAGIRPEREPAAPGPGARPAGSVRLVDVILGYRCNSKCAFCSIDDELRTTNSTAGEIERQIQDSLQQHPLAIRFGGGEPTLWPELPDLVAFARSAGFGEIAVQTNGYLLGEDGLAGRLVDAGLNKLNLSLRGATAAMHDGLTRTRGSFARLQRGLAAVRAAAPGLHVEGDVIVTRQTLPALADVVRELGPRGIRKFNFWYVAMEGRVRGHEQRLVPRLAEVTRPLLEALDAADALGLQAAQSYYVPYCFLPGREGRVWDPAGENCVVVTPNGSFRLELGEIDLGVKTARCRGCRFERRCFGVRPGYVERFGDTEIVPVR